MRLRSFNAPDVHDAMKMVRETMGEEAVIISTTRDPLGKGVCVTVAIEMPDEEAQPVEPASNGMPAVNAYQAYAPLHQRGQNITLREVEKIMRFHNIPDHIISKLLEIGRFLLTQNELPSLNVKDALGRILEAAFSFAPLPIEKEGTRIMLIGAPGVGKTMTIVKMAAHLVMNKKSVVVITTDNKRAGGVEQLSAFTTILGLELKVASTRAELWNLLQECPRGSRVLIDTAGTNPYNLDEMRELKQLTDLDRVIPALVAATGADPSEAEDTARAFAFTGVHHLLITRADVARRLGSVLTMADSGGLTFCNVSSTSKIIGEFRTVDAPFLAQLLMQYRHETMV